PRQVRRTRTTQVRQERWILPSYPTVRTYLVLRLCQRITECTDSLGKLLRSLTVRPTPCSQLFPDAHRRVRHFQLRMVHGPEIRQASLISGYSVIRPGRTARQSLERLQILM